MARRIVLYAEIFPRIQTCFILGMKRDAALKEAS